MEKDYIAELNCALEAAKLASVAILEIYHTNFDVSLKKDKSEVTEADIKSNKIILHVLSKQFPEYAILSEETRDNKERLNNDYCWIVDPLDGTRDFVNHTDSFSINIALSYKQEIVMGIICVPCKNIYYYAIKGQGAYKIENGQTTRIHVSDRKDKIRFVSSKFFYVDDPMFKNPIIAERLVVGSSYK